jgi:uncharacterized membrane protein
MTKNEFLKELRASLEEHVDDADDVIQYYDELISDKIEAGEKEKDIIEEIGSIDDIINNVKVEAKVKKARKQPSLSNGVKALIAILGVLALPILIPVVIVVGALIFALVAIIFALIVAAGSIILAGVVTIAYLIVALFSGGLTIEAVIFTLGTCVFMIGIFWAIWDVAIKLIRKYIPMLINSIVKLINKLRKGGND